ncbi:MAG TPA: TlpA disulfide reductase family protein, partial [Thermoanaerobaculia bacterium]
MKRLLERLRGVSHRQIMFIFEILAGLAVLSIGVFGLVNAQSTKPGSESPLPTAPAASGRRVERWSFGAFLKPGAAQDLVTTRDLEGVVRASYLPPSSSRDVGPLKRALLDPSAPNGAPKAVLLAARPLTPSEHRRFDRLCAETGAVCAIFLSPKKGEKLPVFPDEGDAAGTVPALGLDGGRVDPFLALLHDKAAVADAPLVVALFQPAGELLWAAGLESLEYSADEVGTILRTMIAARAIDGVQHPAAAIARPAEVVALPAPVAPPPAAPASTAPQRRVSLRQLSQTVRALEGGTSSAFSASFVATRKKPLLLIFWGTWCQPCVDEMPLLRDLSRQYAGRLTFVGIAYQGSAGEIPKVRDLVAKNRIDFPQYVIYNQDL